MKFSACVMLVTVFCKVISSQYVCECQRPSSDIIIETSQYNAANTEAVCKNLLSAIQSVIIANLRKNAAAQPIFNSIAPPLIDEIVSSLNCQCPSCSSIKIGSNGYPIASSVPVISSNVPSIGSNVPNAVANVYGQVNSAYANGLSNLSPYKSNVQIVPLTNGNLPCGCQNPCTCKNTVANVLTGQLICGCQAPCSCPNTANVLALPPSCNCQSNPCSCPNKVNYIPTCNCQNSGKVLSAALPCGCPNTFANVLSKSPCSCGKNTVVGILNTATGLSPVVSQASSSKSQYSELISALGGVPSCGCGTLVV